MRDIKSYIDEFSLLNNDSSDSFDPTAGTIFFTKLEHRLKKSNFKKDKEFFSSSQWKKILLSSNEFKARFYDSSAKNSVAKINLDQIGTDAIAQSITKKMFSDKSEIDYSSFAGAGMVLELDSKFSAGLVGKELFFTSEFPDFKDRKFFFTVDWVHLWVFNSDIAILTFQATLTKITGLQDDVPLSISLGDLSAFNRCMRCSQEIRGGDTKFYIASNPEKEVSSNYFYKDIIWEIWLKNQDDDNYSILGLDKTGFRLHQDLQYHHMHHFSWAYLNPFIDNQGQIDTQKNILWDMPYLWPENMSINTVLNNLESQEWNDLKSSMHFAMMEGYPTTKDFILHNYAVTGSTSSNLDDWNPWKINPEHLKTVFNDQHIEMFAEKDGFVTKESMVFISTRTKYHHQSPDTSPRWVEIYYPLYALLLHLNFAVSRFVTKTVDAYQFPEMYIQESKDFQKFRNSFWFSQYGNDPETKLIARKISDTLNLEDRFAHLEKEMQEVSDSILKATHQIRIVIASVFLITVYPFWLLLKSSDGFNLLQNIFLQNKEFSLLLITTGILILGFFAVKFKKLLARLIGKLWSKILSISFDGNK